MAELLESQVAPAEGKQVASSEGEVGEDVDLEEKPLNTWNKANGDNYQYFIREGEEGRNWVSANGQCHLCKNGILKITLGY